MNQKKQNTTEIKPQALDNSPSKPIGLLLLLALLLMGLTYFAYQEAPKNDFVDWDDYTYVIQNDLVRNPKVPLSEVFKQPISLNYHPLTIWSMRGQNNQCATCFEGISAKPFIQWNIYLHLLNVLLLFFWLHWLLSPRANAIWMAALVSLWFGIHPMHVESVAWVSERKDVLYVFFLLLGLLSYARYKDAPTRKGLWYGATLLLFIMACLAKAMAVAMVPVLLLVDYWKHPLEEKGIKAYLQGLPRQLLQLTPFFALAMIFGLMAVKVQAGGNFLGLLKITGIAPVAINDFGVFSFWQRLSFASYGFLMYIYKFFVPTDLCTFYAYPTVEQYEAGLIFKLGPFVFLGSLALAVWSAARTRWLFFGLGFYLATVALVLQFISVGAVIMADRYTYLPYVGWGLVLVGGTTVLSESLQRYVLWAVLGLSLAFIPLTQKQIGVWKDSETLWTQVIRLDPQAEQAYSIRGNFYGKKASKAKTPQDQQAFLNKAFADLSMAVQLKSTRPEVFEGLGNIYGMRGEYPKALENYTKALEYDPNKGSIYFNRGVTHSLLKDYDKAIADYTAAVEKYPERILETLNNRAIAYLESKRPNEAIKDLDYLIKQEPQKASHYSNRAVARQQLGDRAGALADVQRAVQLDPNDAFAKSKLQELSQ